MRDAFIVSALRTPIGKKKGTLSNMPETLLQTAISVHRNILGWMNDRPCSEQKRAPLAYAIVFKAKGEPLMRTEIYITVGPVN